MTTEEKIFNAARTVFQKRVFRTYAVADEGIGMALLFLHVSSSVHE
jgi:hypothetical protein